MHLYVVQCWKQIPLLACVEKVGVQGTTKNIFHLMFIAMATFGGLNVEQSGTKLISMNCDGNNVFQGVKVGVITQMKENVAPFRMGIHYFVHQTNLVVLVLSKLSLLFNWKYFCMLYMSFFLVDLRNSLYFRSCVMCL